MSGSAPLEAHVRRLAEASAWRAALSEADAETSPEFEAWIADPENEAAWDQVQTGWGMVGEHAEAPELIALRRNALARAHCEGRRRWAAPTWRVAIAACFAALVGLGLFWGVSIWRADQPIELATALGERRVVTMADGSRISLDANSEVEVSYSDESRAIELVQGQARFDVAHGDARRFLVRALDRTIVATGTAFNVDIVGNRVVVTLIEGRVVVLRGDGRRETLAAPGGGEGAVALIPGQQLVAAPQAAPVVQPASLERATAWESGQLIFEDEPLGSIADRVSRYSARPIRVESGAADHRISGVFRAGDTATFVDTVTRYLPVRAAENRDGSITLRSAG